jgi:HTH-type transcriptional regulator/antitoxin HigA
MWLDEYSPVIAVSLRYDRIDAFWFTLMHELSHVINRDASLDCDLNCNLLGDGQIISETKEEIERRADNEASSSLISADVLESFILRVGPLYSKTRIIQFAHRIGIHPGIIVGQLQHRGEIRYSANREMLVKIREIVSATSLTDGWGHTLATPF